jgi:hypothetical protein
MDVVRQEQAMLKVTRCVTSRIGIAGLIRLCLEDVVGVKSP